MSGRNSTEEWDNGWRDGESVRCPVVARRVLNFRKFTRRLFRVLASVARYRRDNERITTASCHVPGLISRGRRTGARILIGRRVSDAQRIEQLGGTAA